MINRRFYFLFWLFLLPSILQSQDAREVVERMLSAIEGVKTAKYKFTQNELLRKGRNIGTFNIKLRNSAKHQPHEVYVHCIDPQQGVELLWTREGDDRVLVNPNGFPYINLKFSRFNSRMIDGKHHDLSATGFHLFGRVIRAAVKRSGDRFDDVFHMKDGAQALGKSCYQLEINDPTYDYAEYTVKQGENLIDIATGRDIAEYAILLKNPSIDDFFDVSAGEKIVIPSSYSPKTIAFIDKENHLPILLKLFTENGELFAQYEFRQLEVNPSFADDEFTEDFSDYNF